jgi:hypothetical protein
MLVFGKAQRRAAIVAIFSVMGAYGAVDATCTHDNTALLWIAVISVVMTLAVVFADHTPPS